MKKFQSLWLAIILSISTSISVAATIQDCKDGVAANKNEQYEEAIYLLSLCVTLPLKPSDLAYTYSHRGQAYANTNKYLLAIDDQKKVLELEEPQDVWPFLMLGYYYRDNQQYEKSLEAINKAVNYDEDGPGTGPGMAYYYHKGQTLHELGRYKEAIESYTLGIPKQEDYGYALYRRGLSYEALGDKLQAKRDFFRAVELTPKEGYEKYIAAKLSEYGFTVKVLVE